MARYTYEEVYQYIDDCYKDTAYVETCIALDKRYAVNIFTEMHNYISENIVELPYDAELFTEEERSEDSNVWDKNDKGFAGFFRNIWRVIKNIFAKFWELIKSFIGIQSKKVVSEEKIIEVVKNSKELEQKINQFPDTGLRALNSKIDSAQEFLSALEEIVQYMNTYIAELEKREYVDAVPDALKKVVEDITKFGIEPLKNGTFSKDKFQLLYQTFIQMLGDEGLSLKQKAGNYLQTAASLLIIYTNMVFSLITGNYDNADANDATVIQAIDDGIILTLGDDPSLIKSGAKPSSNIKFMKFPRLAGKGMAVATKLASGSNQFPPLIQIWANEDNGSSAFQAMISPSGDRPGLSAMIWQMFNWLLNQPKKDFKNDPTNQDYKDALKLHHDAAWMLANLFRNIIEVLGQSQQNALNMSGWHQTYNFKIDEKTGVIANANLESLTRNSDTDKTIVLEKVHERIKAVMVDGKSEGFNGVMKTISNLMRYILEFIVMSQRSSLSNLLRLFAKLDDSLDRVFGKTTLDTGKQIGV